MSGRSVAYSKSAGWLAWFALAVVWTVWGSTYLAIGAAVETVPPLLMAGARYMTAGLVLYAVVSRSYARGAQRPTRRQLRSSVIIGALLLVGGNGLLSVGETMLASGLAALIAATVPVWMVIVNAWVTSTPVAKPTQVALVLGTGGVAVLIGWRGGDPIHLGGALIVLLGSFFWAIGSVYARTAEVPKNPLVATSLQMLAGGALLLIAGALTGELGRFQVERDNWHFTAGLPMAGLPRVHPGFQRLRLRQPKAVEQRRGHICLRQPRHSGSPGNRDRPRSGHHQLDGRRRHHCPRRRSDRQRSQAPGTRAGCRSRQSW